MEFQIRDIEQAVVEADGLPRVDWEIVEGLLVANWPAEELRAGARLEAVLQWLELLADALGEDYWINSAPRSVLLTSQSRSAGDELLRFAEQALDKIGHLLDVRPEATGAPKHVLLRLHNMDVYYTYINYFHEDGEYGGSGGMCIREGLPHIVFPRSPFGGEELVVAHELTHAVLNDFDAPLWVEEGVAQIIEQQLTSRPPLLLNHEFARHLRAYWKRHDLTEFWSGRSFYAADDGQRHSYEIAEILVRLILADHRPQFLDFLNDADRDDAGAAAAMKHFNRSLNDLATIFLGS